MTASNQKVRKLKQKRLNNLLQVQVQVKEGQGFNHVQDTLSTREKLTER